MDTSIKQKLLASGANYEIYERIKNKNVVKVLRDPSNKQNIAKLLASGYQNVKLGRNYYKKPIVYILENEYDTPLLENITDTYFNNASTLPTDVMLNLFYLMNNSGSEMIAYTNAENLYILNSSLEQLILLLGSNYNGPTDHASLLFSIKTGKSAPVEDINQDRYDYVKIFPLKKFGYLVKVNDAWNHRTPKDKLYAPFIWYSMLDVLKVEPLILTVDDNNANLYTQKYGLVYNSSESPLDFFLEEMVDYEPVLNRPPNIMPPNIADFPKDDEETTFSILNRFTTVELLNFYKDFYKSKPSSRNIFIIELTGDFTYYSWNIGIHPQCKNGNKIDIITGDLRKDIYNDTENIVLTLGTKYIYNCYSLEELEASFGEDENGNFLFRNPDYVIGSDIDPVTKDIIREEFTIDDIVGLKEFILWEKNRAFDVIMDKIKVGLEYKQTIQPEKEFQELIHQYQNFNNATQNKIKLYLVWLFLYGMYMRFWLGPGYEYPVTVNTKGKQNSCLPTVRDQNVYIQNAVGEYIKNMMYPFELKWITEIKIIKLDFYLLEFMFDSQMLDTVLFNILYRSMCMGTASDLLFPTAYYYLNKIGDVNTTIDQHMPTLLEIEKDIIPILLLDTKELPDTNFINKDFKNDRISALRHRFDVINTPNIKQPHFVLDDISENAHINLTAQF